MRHSHKRSFDLWSSFIHYAPGTGGIFILLALLLAGSLIGWAVTALFELLCPDVLPDTFKMLIQYPLQFIPAMIYASSKSHLAENFDDAPMPLDRNGFAPFRGYTLALMVSAATIATAIAIEPVGMLLPPIPPSIEAALSSITDGPLWVALLLASVFAPFFEEWLCRGMVMRGLLRRTSPVVAITISALFFAVIHFNPWQAIPAFALGCLFGYVYYRTGSLKLTMLMHCVNNTLSIALSRVSGYEEMDYLYQAFTDKMLYGITYAASLLIVALFAVSLRKVGTVRVK